MFRFSFFLLILLLPGFLAPAAFSQEATRKPITVDDLWAMGRVSDPGISPDGTRIAFTVTTYDMDRNKGSRGVYLIPMAGGEARRLTGKTTSSFAPRFSPDGGFLYFLSARGGRLQVWRLPLTGGGEAEQVTHLPVDISGFSFTKEGKHLLVTADVYPGCRTMEANAAKAAEIAERKSKARIIDKLLYRHWNHWRDGRRSHVLLVALDGNSVRDLTPGDADTPPVSLEAGTGYDLSPDGDELSFSRNASREPAVNTNNDIFSVYVKGGEARQVTTTLGNDHAPSYSPDGKHLAHLSMSRPGFEADLNVLMVRQLSTGKTRALTRKLDRSVSGYAWSPDSTALYFTAANHGRVAIYKVSIKGTEPEQLYSQGVSSSLRVAPDGKSLVFLNQAFDRPPEVWSLNLRTCEATRLSRVNDTILDRLEMGKAREFWFTGARNEKVQGFLLTPPGFNPSRNYPAVMLVHGGPQGAFMDSFHWRWNAQMWIAPGYVGVIVNFHGSRGYGQKFCDAVSGDWGGAPYEDVMKGMDFALERFPYIDRKRVGAAGGSYGGFMVNWICGKTDRFACLVSHAGLAEHFSMFGATEELWFPLWEFGGTPWDKPELHEKFSPVRLARNFKTPTLVIHGEHDYRVPYTQGLQMFTALQVQGVPSRLLFFPDECHFIQKPQNARVWWNTIHAWLARYLRPATVR